MANKGRMLSQDIAKALVIISVVLTHTGFLPMSNPLMWFNFFITCPMGFFFLISGYNYKSGKRTPGESIKLRAKQLLLPMVKYAIGTFLVMLVFYFAIGYGTIPGLFVSLYGTLTGTGVSGSILGKYIIGVEHMPTSVFTIPSWFVIHMFVAYVIFFLIADYVLAKKTRLFSCVIGLMSLSMLLDMTLNRFCNPLGIVDAPLIAALLLIGACFGQYKLYAPETVSKKWTIINSVVGIGLCTAFALRYPRVGEMLAGSLSMTLGVAEIPIILIMAMLFSYGLIGVCKLLEKVPVLSPALCWLGKNSLGIYFVHMPVIFMTYYFLGIDLATGFMTLTSLQYITIFLISLVVTIAIVFVIEWVKGLIAKAKTKQTKETVQ